MTTLLHLPVHQQKIRLLADAPLFFLNNAFPDGVPCSPWIISLDGQDCYEFSPDDLPDELLLKQVGAVITSENYPEHLVYGLFRYGTVLIPIEWTETAS